MAKHSCGRERGETERADVEEHVVARVASCAPVHRCRGHGERKRSSRPEEGRSGQGSHGADRDRAVVHLEGQRLAEADEHDEREQGEEMLAAAEGEPEGAHADSDRRDERDDGRQRTRKLKEARAVHDVRPRMTPLLGRNRLDGRWQRRVVVARLRHHDELRLAVDRDRQGLRARVQDAVSALELRPVDGKVCLVDELVGVRPVSWEGGDAERNGRANRLARRFDVEGPSSNGRTDALRDLERLLRVRLGQQDAELLAAEPRRDVVVAQLHAEDLGDALEHGVAGEVAVRVVDVAEQVEVGHDQREGPVEAVCASDLLRQRDTEVARVEEAGLGVDPRLGLELRHAERPVDEEHRGDRKGDQPRIEVPERREDDTEGRQHELRREPVEREEARILDRVAAREHEHRSEQRVVQSDEDE